MSNLRPVGEPLIIGGIERHLLFTLNGIDEIQEHFDASLEEVIDRLTDKRESVKTMKFVLCTLLNDENKKLNLGLEEMTEQKIGWEVDGTNIEHVTVQLLKAYGLSLPEADEFESPNEDSGQQTE